MKRVRLRQDTCRLCGALLAGCDVYPSDGGACKPCLRAERAKYRLQNPEKVKASKKTAYLRYRDKWLVYLSEWRNANYDRYRAGIRAWNEQHPEQLRVHSSAKDARKRNAPIVDLTAAQWQAIKAAYGHKCVYCGTRALALTQDHVVPLSRGGAHTMSNIVPACQPCNSRKNARTPEEAGFTFQRKLAEVYV